MAILKRLLRSKGVRETLWAAASKWVAFIGILITNVILARELGVEAYGVWGFWFAILTIFATVGDLGIGTSSRVLLAHVAHSADASSFLRHAFFVRLVTLAIFLGATIAFLAFVPSDVSWYGLGFSGAFVLYVTGRIITNYFREIAWGFHDLRSACLLNLLEYWLLLACAGVFVAYTEMTLASTSMVFALSVAVAAVWVLFRHRHFLSGWMVLRRSDIVTILRNAVPFFFISLGFMVLTEIDTIMIWWLSSEIELGWYTAAKNLVNRLPQIALVMSMGLAPLIIQRENINDKHALVRGNFLAIILLFVPLCIAIFWFAPMLLSFFYGVEYIPAASVLQIFSAFVFVTAIVITLNGFIDYEMGGHLRALVFIWPLLLNIGLNWYFIPLYWAIAAALSTVAAYSLMALGNAVVLRHLMKKRIW